MIIQIFYYLELYFHKRWNALLVIFIGLDRAGKSSIKVYLESLNLDAAKNTSMSNGIEAFQRGSLKIEVFPGQRRLRYNEKLYQIYFKMARKIVFVVDSADHSRFDEVKRFWGYVQHMIKKYCEDVEDVEIIFVAHKRDLRGSLSAEEIYSRLNLKGVTRVFFVNTSIYDPLSISQLLSIIYGSRRTGAMDLAERLRIICGAEFSFIYDGQVLPVAYSAPKRDNGKILETINDILCILEKIDRIRAFVGFWKKKNIVMVSSELESDKVIASANSRDLEFDNKNEKYDRILVGVFDFRKPLRDVLTLCKATAIKYLSIREKVW